MRDQALLGGEVAALDALGELDLLGGGEQRVPAGLGQELLEAVDRVVDQFAVGVGVVRAACPQSSTTSTPWAASRSRSDSSATPSSARRSASRSISDS